MQSVCHSNDASANEDDNQQDLSDEGTSNEVVGCYRQKNGTIYVSECSSSESQSDDELSSEFEKLTLIKSDQSLIEFRLHKEEDIASLEPSNSSEKCYFCIPCHVRLVVFEVFCEHSATAHQCKVPPEFSRYSVVRLVDLTVRIAEAVDNRPDSESVSADSATGSLGVPHQFLMGSPGSSFFMGSDGPGFIPHFLSMDSFASTSGGISNEYFNPMNASMPTAQMLARNSTKTLKCPKCNWHYKYQETLEIHMKEKHSADEVNCIYCLDNQPHPKLGRGETYSCGYKPYRCEVCKYSTTTKGNLSIHMQSDKHLHAVQELPTPIIPPSQLQPSDMNTDRQLQCLICGAFSTDSLREMLEHLEVDRGRPCAGDITLQHGMYHCHLCPYNTNLKANFQLHTRTDKHIQRVQLVNHMREGNAATTLSPSAAISRLSSVKSLVQVRCRPCQEVMSCSSSVREHCESRTHHSRIAYLQAIASAESNFGNVFGQLSTLTSSPRPASETVSEALASLTSAAMDPITVFECRTCDFETDDEAAAMEHCEKHSVESMAATEGRTTSQEDSPSATDKDGQEAHAELIAMEEAAYYCMKCNFTTETLDKLRAHEESGEHAEPAQEAIEEQPQATDSEFQCPLCPQKSAQLKAHLLEGHKTSEDVVEKLMASSVASTSSGGSRLCAASTKTQIFRYRCSQCSLAFRTEEKLREHALYHAFRTSQRCPVCSEKGFTSVQVLREHLAEKHPLHLKCGVNTFAADSNGDAEGMVEPRCELCQESFAEQQALIAHLSSLDHLHKAKTFLEEQSNPPLQLSEQVLALLQRPSPLLTQPKSSESNGVATSSTNNTPHADRKPFRCHVCRLSYGQGSTLDIHLRSVAHQSRMSRLHELVVAGEVDPSKPVSEQPGGIPQKTIGELVGGPNDMTPTDLSTKGTSVKASDAHPGSSNQKLANFIAPTRAAGQPSNPLAFMNMFNMAQFLQMAQGGSRPTEDTSVPTTSSTPQFGAGFSALPMGHSSNGNFDLASLFKNGSNGTTDASRRKSSSSAASPLSKPSDSPTADNDSRKALTAGSNSRRPVHAEESHARAQNGTSDAPETKRPKLEQPSFTTDSGRSSTASTPQLPVATPKKNEASTMDFSNPMAMMSMMSAAGFPFMANPFMSMMSPDMLQAAAAMSNFAGGVNPLLPSMATVNNTPQKRARTRITDDQLKILRQYFDINNSPTEQQIKEMSVKAQLPEKVIKHWFRNTLFKERQRDKDSPYNFNVPPQLSIDLDTYDKTGEAHVLPVKAENERSNSANPSAASEPVSASNASSTPSSPVNASMTVKTELAEQAQNSATSTPTANSNPIESALSAAANSANFMNSLKQAAAAAAMDYSTAASQQNPFASLLNGMPMDEKMFGSMLSGLGNAPILPPAGFLGPHSSASSVTSNTGTTSMGSGRRANRTRFTDFQLRTLQNFFDKQAYPKDDDLEMLSKKLGLSPRVIVVWFQNARQKARKIYENQPNQDNNDRFVKTPGCNFQCKRCQLVFQRYYELIQHQQKLCYAGDCDAQHTDNKSVEENLTEEEKSGNALPADQGVSAMDQLNSLANFGTPQQPDESASAGGTAFVSENNNTEDLLKLITGGSSSSAEDVLKMFKAREKSTFYKRCPFCGLLFHARDKMLEHFAERHAEQCAASGIDPDALPEAEDVPSITSADDFFTKLSGLAAAGGSPLDLSVPSSNQDNDHSQNGDNSMASPSFTNSDQDEGDRDSPGNFSSAFDFRALSSSPAMSTSSFGAGLTPNTLGAALASVACGNSAAARQQQRSPAAGGSGASKRYRTHLTPVQVYVMKSLFNVYKTPSMSECESLGAEIGLHKRVVQVWFQNARAKERKSRGSATGDEDTVGAAPTHCDLCSVDFNGRTSLQDHIFTSQHIARVKERGAALKGGSVSSTSGTQATLANALSAPGPVMSAGSTEDTENRRQRVKAVRDTVKKASVVGTLPSAITTTAGADAGGIPLDQLPYNLMYGLQGGSLPMIYDPNLMGTPIVLLQIPEAVMKQISSDMAKGLASTTFTQDGHELHHLSGKVAAEDYKFASETQSEVGWACPQCYNVFQQESFLRNHQKLLCQGCDGVFRLIQTHYECKPCNTKFGTQEEFRGHCDTLLHKANRSVAEANNTSLSQLATAVTSSNT